jgi:hypothetical protein
VKAHLDSDDATRITFEAKWKRKKNEGKTKNVVYSLCESMYIYSQSFHNLPEQRAQPSCLVSSFMCVCGWGPFCVARTLTFPLLYIYYASIVYFVLFHLYHHHTQQTHTQQTHTQPTIYAQWRHQQIIYFLRRIGKSCCARLRGPFSI